MKYMQRWLIRNIRIIVCNGFGDSRQLQHYFHGSEQDFQHCRNRHLLFDHSQCGNTRKILFLHGSRRIQCRDDLSYTATEAAYTYGAEWLQQMRMYITENVRFVDEYCKSKLPKIKVYPPQASFLVWLDCRDLKLSQPDW